MMEKISLHKAAYDGNLEDMKKALKAGVPINKLVDGKTALTNACDYFGSDECTEYLLNQGADPNLSGEGTNNALGYACMYGHLKRVKLLLDAGADVNIKGGYGRTPLMYATAGQSEDCTEIMKLLLEKGANVAARHEGDDDTFTDALSCRLWEIPAERFKLLINNGYNINSVKTKYSQGQTPLMWACFCGNLEAVKVLVEAGADVNQKEKGGDSAIIIAMQANGKDQPEIVEYLFDHGADPSSQSRFGYTPVKYAADKGYTELLQKLISGKANLEQKDSFGKETALISAAYKGNLDVVKLLLKEGADIEAEDSRGNTALHHAAWNGHLEIIKLLLEKGADLEHRNKTDWNALLQAIMEGHEEAFNYLLDRGSIFEYHEKDKGASPLMIAAWKGSLPIVKRLLEKGADPKAKDTSGKGILEYAQENNSTQVLEFLREKFSEGNNRTEL